MDKDPGPSAALAVLGWASESDDPVRPKDGISAPGGGGGGGSRSITATDDAPERDEAEGEKHSDGGDWISTSR